MKWIRRFPFTTACVVLIWGLCFCTPPHTSLDQVPMIDKWTHVVMYMGTMGLFWLEYWRWKLRGGGFKGPLLAVWSVVVPVLMGGLIELGQAYCTGGRRSGEWMDFWADSIGVVLAALAGWTVIRWVARQIWRPAATAQGAGEK